MTTSHGGFLIPNAEGSSSTKMAEPDQVDFNTLGNSRWGVVSGCSVTVSNTTASITAGIVVVDGVVVNVAAGQSVTLGAGGSQPRFDLLSVNSAGTLTSIIGTAAADPVFPDVPTSATLLAAVYCPVGSASFNNYVSDKRNILAPVAVSTVTGTSPILLNRYAGTDTFRIDAAGRIEWNNSDTYLYRTDAGSIRLHSTLSLDGALDTGGALTVAGDTTVSGDLRSSNLRKLADGSTFPAAPQGTILQLNGRVYLQTSASSTVWEQVTTSTASNQPGDIKQSLRSPSQMAGWIVMDGSTITESQYPQLFTVDGLSSFIVTGSSPRVMVLPDATDRILMPTKNNPGATGGSSTINLSLNNLPSHTHGVSIAQGGAHSHTATLGDSGIHAHATLATVGNNGAHGHAVIDGVDGNGHAHRNADGGAGGPFIAAVWGGRNKLDGPINDASHTYAVEPVEWTTKSKADISIASDSGGHQHQTDATGSHSHTLAITDAANHTHAVTENVVGGNAAITVQPKYLTVYTYLRT